jgi:hypothetical protein
MALARRRGVRVMTLLDLFARSPADPNVDRHELIDFIACIAPACGTN